MNFKKYKLQNFKITIISKKTLLLESIYIFYLVLFFLSKKCINSITLFFQNLKTLQYISYESDVSRGLTLIDPKHLSFPILLILIVNFILGKDIFLKVIYVAWAKYEETIIVSTLNFVRSINSDKFLDFENNSIGESKLIGPSFKTYIISFEIIS